MKTMSENILSIDTTTKKACVSLYAKEKMYTKCIDNEVTHSEKLLPIISEILNEANINIQDVQVILNTTGPGSFTGIRIGIATIKGLVCGMNTAPKIFAINNLELLYFISETTNTFTLSMIDAKNERAYYALFDTNMNTILPPKNDLISNILKNVKNTYEKISMVGNVMDICHNYANPFDTELLIKLYLNNKLVNYQVSANNLNATYARVSEAQRKKYGE